MAGATVTSCQDHALAGPATNTKLDVLRLPEEDLGGRSLRLGMGMRPRGRSDQPRRLSPDCSRVGGRGCEVPTVIECQWPRPDGGNYYRHLRVDLRCERQGGDVFGHRVGVCCVRSEGLIALRAAKSRASVDASGDACLDVFKDVDLWHLYTMCEV